MRTRYNDYRIDFTQDCIFGQIGLSMNLDSLILLSNTIFNYCTLKGIQIVVLGYDSSRWSERFALEVVLERLTELGMEIHFLDQPCPSVVLAWAANRVWRDSEESRTVMGLYFSSDETQNETLSIQFRHHTGLPFTENEVAEVVAQSFKVQVVELGEVLLPVPEKIEMQRFTKDFLKTDLLDKKLISKTVVSIDNMFGSAEPLIQDLRPKLEFNGQLVNKSSENLRIENYRSIPTERWLQWKVPGKEAARIKAEALFHAAISNAGDQIGIWDLRQGLEISPSGIAMIFLKYFSETLKKKGTVILSKLVSDKVIDTAKDMGFKVHLVNSGADALSIGFQEVGKRSALFYADELGRFWFKGQIVEPNGVASILLLNQICQRYRLSPGQIIDILISKHLKRKYVYGRLFVPIEVKSREELQVILKRDLNFSEQDEGSTVVYRTDYGAKIGMSYDKKTQLTLVEIEAQDENTTREIVQIIQNNCYDPEKVDEELSSTVI